MSNLYIKTQNEIHRQVIINAIVGVKPDYDWHKDIGGCVQRQVNGRIDFVMFNREYPHSRYPIIKVNTEFQSLGGVSEEYLERQPEPVSSLDAVLIHLSSPPTTAEVKLNSQYTAVVSKTEIKVGCQTFPVSILKELQSAVDKL